MPRTPNPRPSHRTVECGATKPRFARTVPERGSSESGVAGHEWSAHFWKAARHGMDRLWKHEGENLLTTHPSHLRNGIVAAYTAFNQRTAAYRQS